VAHIAPINWKDFERVLLRSGCHFDRQVGDHRIYQRDDLRRPIVVPADDPIPVFIIRNNMKTLGISREEYFKLLEEH
jgi:predicted RNA binding protein YcfA (HicA-like mRNA interferase family)